MLLLGPPVLLFALITWQVVVDGPLVGLDERLSGALVHPDRASEVLADLGNVEVAVPALVIALGYAAWHERAAGTDRWWLAPTAGGTAMALVPVLVVPLKAWTDRPGTPVVPPAVGYYPSGHTVTAVVAYGAAALLLLPLLRSAAVRRALVLLCAALVAAVSFGLVRRGYHWPLDVAAGWCLGAVLLICLSLLVGLPVSGDSRPRSAAAPGAGPGPR